MPLAGFRLVTDAISYDQTARSWQTERAIYYGCNFLKAAL